MRKYVGVLMLLILGGCETFHGYPNPPSHIVYPGGGLMPATSLDAAESTALDNYHSSDALKRLTLSPRQYRDAFIYSELKAINDSYDIFAMNMHAKTKTMMKVPPPKVPARYGNRQMLPSPTAAPIVAR